MSEVLEQNALARWQAAPISFITEVLRRPKDGKPFELFPAQRQWFDHCWQMQDDGRLKYPEQLLSWIKKTGKTTTAAMQMLTTLLVFGGRHAQGFCVASDLQQAQERVFADIKQIIEASPLLKPEAVITQSRIVFPQTGAVIQAIGADSAGAAGARPCFISFDEAHTITTERARRLFDEMIPITLGETQKISCRLTTSHAGYDDSTLLRELYDKGTALDEVEPGLRAGNSMLFTWRHECLSPWQTEQWLAEQRKLTRPIQFLRHFENQFVSSETSFISGEMWDACTTLSAPPPSNPMMPVFIGIDASTKRDSTAIVVVNGQNDGVRVVDHKIFVPSTDNPIDFEVVERVLLDLKKKYPLCTIVFDTSQLAFMMQRLSRAGLKTEEFVQNPANLSAMTQNLYDLIRYKKLAVYPNQRLRHAITHALISENSMGQRFAKNKDQKDHNDVVIALAMAALRCTQRHQKSVDLVHKYRAFDPDFRDEDLPPLLKPEPAPLTADANWWKGTEAARAQPTSSADDRLRNLYSSIDNAIKWNR
jgi:phage terminase large subunit-like protein